MLETATALGRPFPLLAWDQAIAGVQQTQRACGAIGFEGATVLGGPALNEETPATQRS
jgi:hypothetical protein